MHGLEKPTTIRRNGSRKNMTESAFDVLEIVVLLAADLCVLSRIAAQRIEMGTHSNSKHLVSDFLQEMTFFVPAFENLFPDKSRSTAVVSR